MFSTRSWRSFLPKLFLSARRQRSRLQFEQLEDRSVPAVVTWSALGGGNWDNAANWSTGKVPNDSDQVVISTVGDASIVIQSGDNIRVQNVTLSPKDTLSFTGGSLTVTEGTSKLSGDLDLGAGSLTADGSGVKLTATATTTATSASLYALGGAVLSLPELQSLQPSSSTLEAKGAASKLTLSNLTSYTGQSLSDTIEAFSGGTVDLPILTDLNANVLVLSQGIDAQGTAAVVKIPKVTELTCSAGAGSAEFTGGLQADEGGQIECGSLTTINSASIVLSDTGKISTSQITDIDDSTLFAGDGAKLTLPGVKSYAAPSDSIAKITVFNATGGNSVLNLPNLSSITNPEDYDEILAYAGGTVDLKGLTSLHNDILLQSQLDSSLISLPNLTSFSDPTAGSEGAAGLVAFNSGRIDCDKLTTFNYSELTVTGTSQISVGQLTNINSSTLSVSNGATLTLPGTNFQGTGSFVDVTGPRSVVNFPNLTTVTDSGSYDILLAEGGGKVNLPDLTTLNANVLLESAGKASLIDLPKLTTMSCPFLSGGLEALSAGKIDCPKLATLTGATLTLSDTAQISMSKITNINNSDVAAEDGATLTLSGVTTYESTGGTYLEATGTGTGGSPPSELNLPNLTTFTDNSNTSNPDAIDAYSGGIVNLTSLTNLSSNVQQNIQGTGSEINLPS